MSGSTGNWITQTVNGMQYDVLLPQGYNPGGTYSATLYLHQLDMGDWPAGLVQEVNPWFNTPDNHSIVVMPLLDQTSDPGGTTINFGGVSPADTAGEANAIAALNQVMSQYPVDPSRVYVTGNSMGGIGTNDMMIKYNAYGGTEGRIFAAGLSLSGADYGQGFPTPDASAVRALQNVPFWTINGGQDTQVPPSYNQTLDAALKAAGDTKVVDTLDPGSGHDTWHQYYGEGYGAGTPLGWLDSQGINGAPATPTPAPVAAAPAPTPAPVPAPASVPSANDTVIKAGSSGTITDGSGNTFSITATSQMAVNGNVDITTSGVAQLTYVNGGVWQENTSGNWWTESGQGAPNGEGSPVSPLPGGQATPAPTPVATPAASPGPGPDALTVNAAGYAVQGVRPQFIAFVDGNKVGGVNTVGATEYDGSSNGGNEPFTFSGNWGPGRHVIGIDFINNIVSPTGDDSNLFVNSITLDGNPTVEYNQGSGPQGGFLYQNGTDSFTVVSGPRT